MLSSFPWCYICFFLFLGMVSTIHVLHIGMTIIYMLTVHKYIWEPVSHFREGWEVHTPYTHVHSSWNLLLKKSPFKYFNQSIMNPAIRWFYRFPKCAADSCHILPKKLKSKKCSERFLSSFFLSKFHHITILSLHLFLYLCKFRHASIPLHQKKNKEEIEILFPLG